MSCCAGQQMEQIGQTLQSGYDFISDGRTFNYAESKE